MTDLILSVFDPVRPAAVFVAVWILVMISVPVIRWTLGQGAERIGIAAGVVAQVSAVVAAIAGDLGSYAIIVVVSVPVLGWASEVLGSRTGVPFGPYHYTPVLQPQIARVPVLIPLAWLMMMPPSWAVGSIVAPGSPLLQWVVAAGAFAAWDVYLDPMMVEWNFWEWKRKGAYLGIPFVNFVGWFVVAFAINALLALVGQWVGVSLVAGLPAGPLLLIFLVTWVLMFIGQMLFWRLRVSAISGFIAMGVFVALLVARLGL